MAIKIIGVDERLAAASTKNTILVLGEYGVGKRSLLFTLPEESTLAIDFEAGMKSVQTWKGDVIEIRTWADAIDVACLIGGANPALGPNDAFSTAHYEHVKRLYAGINMDRYKNIFFDSISDLTHVAMLNAKQGNYTKQGSLDVRGAYGDMGRDTLGLLKHMQHAPQRNVYFVGRLECVTDAFNREVWQPQMEGQRVGRDLPGIVDQVVSMAWFTWSETTGYALYRGDMTVKPESVFPAFVCRKVNPWGLPAKERTLGNIEMIEPPDLGKLVEKINAPAAAAASLLKTLPSKS